MNKIRLTNITNNEIFTYSTILIKGLVDSHDESNIILKHYSHNGKQLAESRWTVNKNKFKIIIELKIGDNMLVFKFANEVLHTKLVYKQRVTNYTVCPVYVICADHDGRFQAPVDHDNSVQNACTKITLCSKLIQMLTAEKMYEKGFGKKTFKVEKECRIIKSSLTRRTVFNMHPEKLWEYIARELTAGQNSKTQKYLAFLSCTYWDGQNLHGHVALGGGGLALFGTGCLYTWPSKLEEVLPCFMNMAKVDTGTLLDDSCFRGNFGGCFSTTLGSVWHELGHTFDLGHSKYGIMGRGFDNVHLIFTLDNKNIAQEIKPANKGYIICIENYSNTINMKDDMSNNNNTNENENETIDEYDSKHIICWSMGCASILSFHKWFNDFKEENNNEHTIDYVAKRNLLTSRNGLRVVQLRREDGLVMHSWEFVKNNNKRTFILPVQLANNGITIIAEDSYGNILKHLL
ncbi:putative zinc metalloproteinase C607.06c isoform X1 [Myzus persicae]|uniref:putative zinc metalloproteinase C607.06c isoform X1 n=1 Tax=Myzus persicae TaxID=13164 RepID=UPI000B93218E|nr:putative zinc metalloproteinase C607.06c isoform X1 [Myzus persicae]